MTHHPIISKSDVAKNFDNVYQILVKYNSNKSKIMIEHLVLKYQMLSSKSIN